MIGAGVVTKLSANGAGVQRGVVPGDKTRGPVWGARESPEFLVAWITRTIRPEQRYRFAVANVKSDSRERH